MDKQEEKAIERKVKKEERSNVDAEALYAGVANGIPNETDQGGDFDALNANFQNGEMGGSHSVNINTQTDLELGGLADPGGMDPAMDRQFLKNMQKNIQQKQ